MSKDRNSPIYAILSWNPENLEYKLATYVLTYKNAENVLDTLRKKHPEKRFEIFVNIKDVDSEEKRANLKNQVKNLKQKLREKGLIK